MNLLFNLKHHKSYPYSLFDETYYYEISFLGHGYTEYNLPYDSSSSITNVKLQLSNNDFIIAKTCMIYSKQKPIVS